MESLKKCIIIDCHDSANAESRNDIKQHANEEIKTQTTQTNQTTLITPYPNLSYETIPPELAWDLNLPLPQSDMVKFESHGSGSVFTHFLIKIGIDSMNTQDSIDDGKLIYISLFNGIKGGKRAIILRNYISIRNKGGKKLHALIQKPKVMCLNQVRDPISSLKHYMSVRRLGNAPRVFNLSFDTQSLVSQLVRYSSVKGVNDTIPNTSNIRFWIGFRYMCFHDSTLFNEMISIKEVEFMDMSEIVGERTLEALQRFANIFDTEVKEEDREFFLTRNHDFGGLLPLKLYLHEDDIEKINFNNTKSLSQSGGIYLHIVKKFNLGNMEDITEELLGECPKDFMIRLCLNKEDSARLKEKQVLFQCTKTYTKELVANLIKQDEIEKSKKLTENDVLEVLKSDKELRMYAKKVFDEHTELIKTHRPDIVESWKYYQEFERMCKELE